jgi:transmembrane sensor
MTPDDELPEPKRNEWDVDAMWSRVRARAVDVAGQNQALSAPADSRSAGWRWIKAYAAAAVIVVAAGFGALFVRARFATPASRAPSVYTTSRGQYATVRLGEGSEIVLAPESRLVIAAGFAEGTREVSLDGEAIFGVHHDAAHPFRVRARGTTIEDIGTRFDVRAYAGDAVVTVAVTEGSVSLGDMSSALVLTSGEVGTRDSTGHVTAERTPGAAAYLRWQGGHLSFVERPLPEVLRAIGRWYDLDVRVPDTTLARRVVTAEFSTQSADQMLGALALAVDAKVERAGRVVTLRPR